MLPVDLNAIKDAQKRIAPYILKTPLLPLDSLSHDSKNVLLKCETLQKTGSFKIRGATNCILKNLEQAKKDGVVAASAGNHAQGVAWICKRLDISATIVMPKTTPAIKVYRTKRLGAKVELVGSVYDESYAHAKKLSNKDHHLFVHAFNNADVIAGQGTIALELTEEDFIKETEALVVSVGGGGLVSGCLSVFKKLYPKIKVYGVVAKSAPALWNSFKEGKLVEAPVKASLAEGVSLKTPNKQMFQFLKKNLDDLFAINELPIAHAISHLAEHAKLVVEGAGALPVAAMLEGMIPEKKVICLISGGNLDLPTLSKVLEHGMVEQDRLVRLVITLDDRPGTLNTITEVLAKMQANILQLFHQRASLGVGIGEVEVEADLETRSHEHTQQIIEELTQNGFRVRRIF